MCTDKTLMSSCWPKFFAASAMACAGWLLMAWVRSKPKSSRFSLVASTTPSETNVSRCWDQRSPEAGSDPSCSSRSRRSLGWPTPGCRRCRTSTARSALRWRYRAPPAATRGCGQAGRACRAEFPTGADGTEVAGAKSSSPASVTEETIFTGRKTYASPLNACCTCPSRPSAARRCSTGGCRTCGRRDTHAPRRAWGRP